jgi:diguanylate cyclase (GGDEF)-like protein
VETKNTIYPRFLRPLVLLLGLAVYVGFTYVLWQNGFLPMAGEAYYLLAIVWAFGLGVLLVLPQRLTLLSTPAIILMRALWCNLGIVGTAILVPHSVRVLLLVIPIFAVFYTALHLSRKYVVIVTVTTLAFYVLCGSLLAGYANIDVEFETLLGIAFALMMSGGLMLAWEALRLQDRLLDNRRELETVLERVQEMALRDELTGVHNRRYLMEVLERQKALADRNDETFTICYCDLDNFKRLNDEHGHAVGDIALRKFAQLASAAVRNVDYVARFGGEEFVLVLVGAQASVATKVAERLVAKTKQLEIRDTPKDYALSVSIGIATYRADEAIDVVLGRADQALYEAKKAGRDRVLVAV